jgi:serine/threonine protein kinase/Tol biopolymer transport system component
MQPERWQQIDQLFHLALAQEANGRAKFLEEECVGDAALRTEVEALIASHEQAQSFIENPASDLAAEILAKDEHGLIAGQALGPYKIVSTLGRGGMGEVYLAQDTRLRRQVALKVLPSQFTINPDRVRRFEQEAVAVSALNHPNIVTIHEIGRDNDSQFIVTEFVEGQTLRQRMADTVISVPAALDISIQVASALAAAHAGGIVHRDIKPENIMLRTDGYVKVLDFGLAKLTESSSTTSTADASTLVKIQTNYGLVMGTAAYMSPEQARGLGVDTRTDIFSLGVVLYEMIAARAPFEGATISDVIATILKQEPAPLGQFSLEVPVELEWMMKKALAKDREERYQTIKELQIDLRRLKQELELQAKLERMTPATRQDVASVARNTSHVIENLTTAGSSAASTAEIVVPNIKRPRWGIAMGLTTIIIGVVAIALFSRIGFYAGLRQAPALSYPTYRQLTFRRGNISTARFAPNGNTLIYSAAFDGKPVELFTSRLESPESRSLKSQVGGRVAGIQSVSAAGEMALLLDCEMNWGECVNGTLARMPLDGGTPHELLENVYAADWSPDGKELAIIRVVEGEFQLEYPKGKVLYKAPGLIDHLRVSPKGDLLAFIDHPILDDPSGSIAVVDLNGEKKVLSEGWQTTKGLAWSPSGDEVWFSAGKNRTQALYAVTISHQERLLYSVPGDLRLYDVSRDGRALIGNGQPRGRMITFTPGNAQERDLSWFDWSTSADLSADGKNLLFYEWGMAVGGVPLVYLRRVDGSNDPVLLGQGKAMGLSPDGKWALALQEGPHSQLVLLPTGAGEQAGEPRLLPRGDIKEYHYASWFPDGERILFTGLLDPSSGLRSYVQDLSGGQPRPVTDEGMIALLVSPDGKYLLGLASGHGPDGKYYLCPIDGSKPTPVSGLGLGDVPIQWSADGRALYVREDGEFDSGIYRLNLPTGGRELVKKIVPDPVGLIGLEVKPGGIQITPDGKSYVYTYWSYVHNLFLLEGLK